MGYSGEFAAHAWLLGEHERALRLALAEPNPFDRAAMKSEKAILRTHWGHWAEAKALLPRSSARSIVTYLVDHPTDYRGAFARLRRELRMLYFSAFQSHLWNLMLARWLECNADRRSARPGLAQGRDLPLPSAGRARGGPDSEPDDAPPPVLSLAVSRRTTRRDHRGIPRRASAWRGRTSGSSTSRISSSRKGARPCLFFPERLEFAPIDDDLHPGRRGLRLSFELSKGSYATILVKRLTDVAGAPR